MIVKLNAIHQTKRNSLEKSVNEHNVQSILDDIDEFISNNMGMRVCDIAILGDGYGFNTVVRICKKFDIFDLYQSIENAIYRYLY